MPNEYAGFHPPSSKWQPDRVDPFSITPRAFFDKYVATRTPCILTAFPAPAGLFPTSVFGDDDDDDDDDHVQEQPTKQYLTWTWNWMSLESLLEEAADAKVTVESKDKSLGRFGSGLKRQKLRFVDFIQRLKDGDESLYMTTQYKDSGDGSEDEEDGEEDGDGSEDDDGARSVERNPIPDYLCPPLDKLPSTSCATLKLFGHLTPFSMNLWIGATSAPEGTSSGLHHDFNDNFYLLQSGRKRFTLFSPKDTDRMYLHGNVKHVHANGLQEYEDSSPFGIRSDGAYIDDVAQYKMFKAIEDIAGPPIKGVSLKELRRRERVATQEYNAFYESSKLEEWKKRRESKREEERNGDKEPTSFSRVPVKLLHEVTSCKSADQAKAIAQKGGFPLLAGATPVAIDLSPGESMYLPAGWFHEVRSFGKASNNPPAKRKRDEKPSPSPANNIHIALNYWLAPPSTSDFKKPYVDGYWDYTWWKPVQSAMEDLQHDDYFDSGDDGDGDGDANMFDMGSGDGSDADSWETEDGSAESESGISYDEDGTAYVRVGRKSAH
ncbi:cupin-like domain-containing protein [Entophlyctis helioformis]|nr:cupin-like domain-containing protein [Entophlyctis helioformis]